jgi:DNA-binding PucR family transcriptional regulator
MNKSSQPLAVLIEENKIDVYELLDFFTEAIRTETLFLELTLGILSLQDNERTLDTLALLTKFKKRLRLFSLQNNVLPVTFPAAVLPRPDYDRLMNALKFLLLLKDFPMVLDELTDEEDSEPFL